MSAAALVAAVTSISAAIVLDLICLPISPARNM
jgi:hypothetical protein